MGTRSRALLSVGAIAVCVGLAASACSSGSTAGVESASSSASASPAFPVESLPPGVQKDSVFDLNSTKDMTGVVTTVPFGQSPYAANLPNVCDFVPNSLLQELGLATKLKAFRGTQLVVQTCDMQGRDAQGTPTKSLDVSFYTNNIRETLDPKRVQILEQNVAISPRVNAVVKKSIPGSPDDETAIESCDVAWGTFFGAIVVSYQDFSGFKPSTCNIALSAAKAVVQSAPRSPSQMRASS